MDGTWASRRGKQSLTSDHFPLMKRVLALGISVQNELLLWEFNSQNAFSHHEQEWKTRPGGWVFLSEGNVEIRRNKPPPSERRGFKNHISDCQTTSLLSVCKDLAPWWDTAAGFHSCCSKLALSFGMSHWILIFDQPEPNSYLEITVSKLVWKAWAGRYERCHCTGKTKHAAFCWELNSWKTAGRKPFPRASCWKIMFSGSRNHLCLQER